MKPGKLLQEIVFSLDRKNRLLIKLLSLVGGKNVKIINVAEDFSKKVTCRYKKDAEDGVGSAEELRTKVIEPALKSSAKIVVVDLGWVDQPWYSAAFLEETFGGLARDYVPKKEIDKLCICCTDPCMPIQYAEFAHACMVGEYAAKC